MILMLVTLTTRVPMVLMMQYISVEMTATMTAPIVVQEYGKLTTTRRLLGFRWCVVAAVAAAVVIGVVVDDDGDVVDAVVVGVVVGVMGGFWRPRKSNQLSHLSQRGENSLFDLDRAPAVGPADGAWRIVDCIRVWLQNFRV